MESCRGSRCCGIWIRKRLTTAAAAQLLGLGRCQVFRLLKAYRTEGPTGLISKRRGRRSNRRKPEPLRKVVLAIVCQWYWDFGPTLAAEKLREDHGIAVGRETLRQWHLQFVESESTFAYFHAARAYLEAWGKPVAFYSDKHGVFRVNHPGALGGDGMTQFGRALHALNTDIICANSSPAKGRVERANKTLQDRLVKSLPSRRRGNCGWRVRPPWRKATPSSRLSRPTTTRALPSRRRTTRICTDRCAPATISTTRLPGKKNAPCHRP